MLTFTARISGLNGCMLVPIGFEYSKDVHERMRQIGQLDTILGTLGFFAFFISVITRWC